MSASTQAWTLSVPDSKPFMTAVALSTLQGSEDRFNDPDALSAYRLCLQFEHDAEENANVKVKSESEAADPFVDQDHVVICARVLGYLLLLAPSSQALAEVVKVIRSCKAKGDQYDELYKLGDLFINIFIPPFRKYERRTPWTSERLSPESFDSYRESLLANLKEVPKDHKQAKELALIRDGNRCMVSGRYDALVSRLEIVSVEEALAAGGVVITKCAHIVPPESTYFIVKGAEAKTGYAASVLTVLKHFGYDADNLNGEGVYSVFNAMTMEPNVHEFFSRLEVWFEKTDIPNQYHPKSAYRLFCLPEVVTFVSSDPECLPVPSSELLTLHAICSKVAHLSGAAEYLDKYDRDVDDLNVLAPDGASSAILHHAIWEKLGGAMDTGT